MKQCARSATDISAHTNRHGGVMSMHLADNENAYNKKPRYVLIPRVNGHRKRQQHCKNLSERPQKKYHLVRHDTKCQQVKNFTSTFWRFSANGHLRDFHPVSADRDSDLECGRGVFVATALDCGPVRNQTQPGRTAVIVVYRYLQEGPILFTRSIDGE